MGSAAWESTGQVTERLRHDRQLAAQQYWAGRPLGYPGPPPAPALTWEPMVIRLPAGNPPWARDRHLAFAVVKAAIAVLAVLAAPAAGVWAVHRIHPGGGLNTLKSSLR